MKTRILFSSMLVALLLVGMLVPAMAADDGPQLSSGPSGRAAKPAGTEDVLWEQVSNGLSGLISQNFYDESYAAYSSDDFENLEPWSLESIFVDGLPSNSFPAYLDQALALTWCIYPDAGGAPAGYPMDGSGTEFWCYSTAPTAPEVTLTDSATQATLDIVVATGAPLEVPPGIWWLVFYPDLSFPLYGQWFWDTADPAQVNDAHVIDPTDHFGMGWTWWTPWTSYNPDYYSLAFRLDGTIGGGCENNDECDCATVVDTYPFNEVIDVSWATTAPDDPVMTCGYENGATVWYSFTAPEDGTVDIETCDSDYDTVLAIYGGSCGAPNLIPIDCNDDYCGLQSGLHDIAVAAGTTYLIEVAGYYTTPGGNLDFFLDFTQDAEPPDIVVDPAFLAEMLCPDEQYTTDLYICNEGGSPLNWHLTESPPGGGLQAFKGIPFKPTLRQQLESFDPAATSTAGILSPGGNEPMNVLGAGDVLAQWPTYDTLNWGDGFSLVEEMLWINDNAAGGGTGLNEEFDLVGNRTGSSFTPSFGGDWPGDMAFNPNTGMFWQVNVGGDNCIYEWDPAIPAATGNAICGTPWTGISQRGLAYDPTDDTFFIGGWNENIVYHIQGETGPNPGEVIEQWFLGIGVAGLAYNFEDGQLFILENSATDTFSQFDVGTGTVVNSFVVTGFGNYVGAGLAIECDGNLWAPNQGDNNAYLIDSGVPADLCGEPPDNIPWLSEDPTGGTVDPGNCTTVDVTFDSTGLAPGTYTGELLIESNDPDEPEVFVGVELVVDPCAADTMHVQDIVVRDWHGLRLLIKVQVADQDDAPILGVLVDANITTPVFDWARWRYTKPSGWSLFWAPITGPGNYQICIENLTHAGYTYEPGDNVYDCMDWDWPFP